MWAEKAKVVDDTFLAFFCVVTSSQIIPQLFLICQKSYFFIDDTT
jgi:hypothetical protein